MYLTFKTATTKRNSINNFFEYDLIITLSLVGGGGDVAAYES